jgi:Beta-lactamase enzyme family/Bacterial tandem repeat domain 1
MKVLMPRWLLGRRALAAGLLAVALTASAVTVGAAPALATQANPSTNDQSTTVNTAWWAYNGVTASQVGSLLTTNAARLTQIRVENPAVPTFDVTMVSNSGVYASGWWWYYGLTGSQVSSTLTTNNARLISLEPYVVGGSLRFAVVEVPNTGAQGRAWWWYYGESQSGIASTLSANNSRLISLRPYQISGTTYYAVIEVSNSGADFADTGWSYAFNQTPSQISATIQANSYRLIAIAADPAGGFDPIYLGSEGEGWTWYYGESATNLVNLMLNNGERLIDITPYSSGGTTVYAGVGLDNTNVLQSPINTTSANVDSYAAANGWGGGLFGAYLAPTNSPGSPLVAFNSGYRFEPASTIKVLYLLYALKQVQAGADSLSSSFTYYVSPSDPTNPGVCPQQSWEVPANAVTTTLGNALQLMMYNSDNRVTRGMEERYGIANVQAMAASLGLSHTSLAQPFIGCTFQGAVRNELTASDVARLYSLVKQKLELNSTYTKLFFNDELGGVPSSTDYLVTVIDQEAAKLGKSSQVAAAFASQVVNHWKAGGYVICMASDCSAYKADYSVAGVLTLPAKTTTGTVVPKSYAYSDFVNDLYVPCKWNSGCAADTAAGAMIGHVADEAARPAIDKALKNW